jgi:hypothetical protein
LAENQGGYFYVTEALESNYCKTLHHAQLEIQGKSTGWVFKGHIEIFLLLSLSSSMRRARFDFFDATQKIFKL